MEDPRNQQYVDPLRDHPSLIYTPINNPVGDPNGDKFMAALRAYLLIGEHDALPVVKLHGRGPGIDVAKTLALSVYAAFPNKDKWLKESRCE